MINLKSIYGDKLFDTSPYRYALYTPRAIRFILEIILALVIVKIFHVGWNYAFLKVLLLLELSANLKYFVDFIQYRFIGKQLITSQMKHYLGMFSNDVNWDDIGCYEDFLLEASFSETLPDDLKVLAGMQYASVIGAIAINPRLDSRYYTIYNEVVEDYIPLEWR